MTDREKLIELLTEAEEHAVDFCIGQRCEDCTARKYGIDCRKYLQADHLIANGVTIATDNKWIHVTERLPEKYGKYLCRYVFNGENSYPHIDTFSYYTNIENPRFQGEGFCGMRVTHWMPLPSAEGLV